MKRIKITQQVSHTSYRSTFKRLGSLAMSWFSSGPIASSSGLFRFANPDGCVEPPRLLLPASAFPPLPPGMWVSSRRKLGPEPTTGVAKFRGLGSVLLSLPLKFHSG